MTELRGNRTGGLSRIDSRFASACLSLLATVIVIAGIAASTQAIALPQPTMPVHLSADESYHTATGIRQAHRLTRSPIRFFGSAEARQIAVTKRVQA
jgi:hypothetical protein